MSPRPCLLGLTGAALLLAACPGGEDGGQPPPARVVAVPAETARADLAGFCDVTASPGHGRPLALPALDGSPPASRGRWLWVSFWATWCRPCIEEMPIVIEWERQLAAEGVPLEVLFVSIDESAAVVEAYRRRNPLPPATLRVADPTVMPTWLGSQGLDPGATIPLHLFADPEGRVRCARSGAVGAGHLPTLRALLAPR